MDAGPRPCRGGSWPPPGTALPRAQTGSDLAHLTGRGSPRRREATGRQPPALRPEITSGGALWERNRPSQRGLCSAPSRLGLTGGRRRAAASPRTRRPAGRARCRGRLRRSLRSAKRSEGSRREKERGRQRRRRRPLERAPGRGWCEEPHFNEGRANANHCNRQQQKKGEAAAVRAPQQRAPARGGVTKAAEPLSAVTTAIKAG